MHAVSAMFAGGVCRDGAVVCLTEDRARIRRGGGYRAKNVGCGRFFS